MKACHFHVKSIVTVVKHAAAAVFIKRLHLIQNAFRLCQYRLAQGWLCNSVSYLESSCVLREVVCSSVCMVSTILDEHLDINEHLDIFKIHMSREWF